ncbi:hypothetical protein NMT12_20152 [metagenome]
MRVQLDHFTISHSIFSDLIVVKYVKTNKAIAPILIGSSKFVRNEKAVAPTEPNVEMAANPTGPQLQAPAIDPINELKRLPLIFPLDFFRIFIL